MSAQESMEIINSMIQKARKGYEENNYHFLLWGWIVLIASLFHFTTATFTSFEYPFAGWALTLVGAVLSSVRGSKDSKRAKVVGYTDKLYGWLWTSLGLAMFTIVFNGIVIDWEIIPFIMLLAAVGTNVSGAMMRFKPLHFGAAVFWILAIVAFQLDENYQNLCMAIGVAFGYLVPGYLMKKGK